LFEGFLLWVGMGFLEVFPLVVPCASPKNPLKKGFKWLKVKVSRSSRVRGPEVGRARASERA